MKISIKITPACFSAASLPVLAQDSGARDLYNTYGKSEHVAGRRHPRNRRQAVRASASCGARSRRQGAIRVDEDGLPRR